MSREKLPSEVIRAHKGVSFPGIVVTFILHDGNGHFLMAKLSQNARDEHGRWEIPGGGLKWGHTLKDTVIREAQEECGATPVDIEFLGYRDVFRELADGTKTHWLAMDFVARVNRNEVKLNEPDMFDDIGWFTLDDQPTPQHSQHHVIMTNYKDKLQKILS